MNPYQSTGPVESNPVIPVKLWHRIALSLAGSAAIGVGCFTAGKSAGHRDNWEYPVATQMKMVDGKVTKAMLFMKDRENHRRLLDANKGDEVSHSGTFEDYYMVVREVTVEVNK